MRLAVLLHGMPRYLEDGAWWMRNKVFNGNDRLKVDYFVNVWNDGSENLHDRIVKAYNPVQIQISNYDEHYNNLRNEIQHLNENCQLQHLLPDHLRYNVLQQYSGDNSFARNFWGQFLSCDLMTKMTGDLTGQYDIICRTRTDVAFNPMHEVHWLKTFHNIYKNPQLTDKVFSDWMFVKAGNPYVGDFAFFSRPEIWYNYTKNFRQNIVDLCTKDKLLWWNDNMHETEVMPFPHKTWMHLSQYSNTDWLSFAVTWPTPYGSTLFRQPIVPNETYQSLVSKYSQHG